jgi:hypothetical protein
MSPIPDPAFAPAFALAIGAASLALAAALALLIRRDPAQRAACAHIALSLAGLSLAAVAVARETPALLAAAMALLVSGVLLALRLAKADRPAADEASDG